MSAIAPLGNYLSKAPVTYLSYHRGQITVKKQVREREALSALQFEGRSSQCGQGMVSTALQQLLLHNSVEKEVERWDRNNTEQ